MTAAVCRTAPATPGLLIIIHKLLNAKTDNTYCIKST